MRQKVRRQLWIGIGISIVALYLALLGIDLPQVKLALSQAEYVYLIPAALAVLAGVVARSVRWQVLLGPGVSLERTFWVTGIGYLASNVLPFRLGDPIRAVVIGRGDSVSTVSALSTVVVERVLDMLTVVTLLAGLAPFIGGAGKTMGAGMMARGSGLGGVGCTDGDGFPTELGTMGGTTDPTMGAWPGHGAMDAYARWTA